MSILVITVMSIEYITDLDKQSKAIYIANFNHFNFLGKWEEAKSSGL